MGSNLSPVIKLRVLHHISEAELGELRDLLDAIEAADDHAALGEHKWLDLLSGGRQGFAGIVAEDPPHPHPVGYAHLSCHGGCEGAPPEGPKNWALEVAVDPEHRGIGVEVALVEAAIEVAREAGGGTIHFWVFHPTEIHEALAHRMGFRRGRELFQMRRSLPHPDSPTWPAGITVRPFVPGQDENAWLAVNNRAFAGHPEQGTWERTALLEREAEAWFDPEGFLLADNPDGSLAGFCWTKVHPPSAHDPGGLGEIYVIAADPSAQGTGLGKALVLGGLKSLAGHGVPTAMLYVDSANESAVGLYRRLGFDVHHLDRAYVIDLGE